MASTKLMETKDGRRFWKISVSRGYGKSALTTRFYWEDGWSKRYAESQLRKAVASFELQCANGEVLTRAEAKENNPLLHSVEIFRINDVFKPFLQDNSPNKSSISLY